ncbi:unnamed protein product [Adineta steineri]|uniref:Fibronectin type-III domain-containing protein n=1 Tax=Adineta steineri TaxID=433720 RepID=A0A818ZGA6_9BILA|nr:unnamed protein product [Adineta steineri]
MAKQQAITMVALGRPFRLGMLYDARNDKLISGITLWDPQILANHTITRNQPYTGCEIITKDSLQHKAHALGVDANLKLSLLGGLMNISGSAKYAEDYQRTNHETRLTLKYSTTTHFQQLSMKHLSKNNQDHPGLHDENRATHVVTGVVYGAEAFFIFDRTISNSESKKEISGSLKAIFDKPLFKTKGQAKLNFTDQEKNFVDKLHCKFYGDFRLNKNPNNFDEAVTTYRQLPSLLGVNNENAIPKKVWLYPLHLLDNKAMRIIREISSNLVDYSISTIENLHSLEVRALDLSESKIFTHFSFMKTHLSDFAARLSEFQRDLKEKLALYLPKLRGDTGVQESVLFQLYRQVDSSPFYKQTLESWLEEKEKEIALMTTWIENLAKDILIKSSSLDEVIDDIRYDYIFCLSLRLVEENDPQLTDMENYLHNKNTFNSSTTRKQHTPWFADRRSMTTIRKNLRQFKEFAEANNVENAKIKFIVNEEYPVNDTKTIKLILYDDGLEKSGFIIPSKPGAPYAISVTDNNVTLEWADATSGTEKVQNYKVMYQKYRGEPSIGENVTKKEERWTEVHTNASHMKIIISNLPSSTKFVFKVQSVTAIGLSAISACSEIIETLANKVEPKFNKWQQNAITVAGGNGEGQQLNQLSRPEGIFIDENKTIFIADFFNHRIVAWKYNAKQGQIVAGGNGPGNRRNQLNMPRDVIVDQPSHSIIIAVWGNRRVIQWVNQKQQLLIENIDCHGLAIDKYGFLYVSDYKKNEVRRWKMGEYNDEGIIVAGGNGQGNQLNQLYRPVYIFVDEEQSVYISDSHNHRVMKWRKDAKEGIVVAGGNGEGGNLNQLSQPTRVIVDDLGQIYVADSGNHRIMRWCEGKKEGEIVVGGNGAGNQSNQLSTPMGLSFDDEENLYVADYMNHRIQKFEKFE